MTTPERDWADERAEKLVAQIIATTTDACAVEPIIAAALRDAVTDAEAKDLDELTRELLDKNAALQKRITELEAKAKGLVDCLESISKMDVSATVPDILWLADWRNSTKQTAREALAAYSKASKEGV